MNKLGLNLASLVFGGASLVSGLNCSPSYNSDYISPRCSSRVCERRVERPKSGFNPKDYYWEDARNIKVFLRNLHPNFRDLRSSNFYTTKMKNFGKFDSRTSSFDYGDEIWVVFNLDGMQLQRFKGDLIRIEYHDEHNNLRSNTAFYVGGLNKIPAFRINTSNYSYRDISNGYQKVHLKIGPDGQEPFSAGVLLFEVD